MLECGFSHDWIYISIEIESEGFKWNMEKSGTLKLNGKTSRFFPISKISLVQLSISQWKHPLQKVYTTFRVNHEEYKWMKICLLLIEFTHFRFGLW